VSEVTDEAVAIQDATTALEEAAASRDEAIVRAHESGMSLRDIAEWAGVSHTTVSNILARRRSLL